MVSSDYPRHDGSAAEVVTTLSEPHSPADSLFDDYSDDESESPPSAPTSAVTNRPQTPAAVVLAVPSQQTSPIPLPAPRFTFEPPTPAIPEPQAPSPSTAPLVPPDKRKRKAVDATPPTTAALSPSRPQKVTRVLDVTDDAMAATSTQVVRTAATHTPASVVPSGPVGVSPMRGRSVVYHPQAPPPDFNEMLAIIERSGGTFTEAQPEGWFDYILVPDTTVQNRLLRAGKRNVVLPAWIHAHACGEAHPDTLLWADFGVTLPPPPLGPCCIVHTPVVPPTTATTAAPVSILDAFDWSSVPENETVHEPPPVGIALETEVDWVPHTEQLMRATSAAPAPTSLPLAPPTQAALSGPHTSAVSLGELPHTVETATLPQPSIPPVAYEVSQPTSLRTKSRPEGTYLFLSGFAVLLDRNLVYPTLDDGRLDQAALSDLMKCGLARTVILPGSEAERERALALRLASQKSGQIGGGPAGAHPASEDAPSPIVPSPLSYDPSPAYYTPDTEYTPSPYFVNPAPQAGPSEPRQPWEALKNVRAGRANSLPSKLQPSQTSRPRSTSDLPPQPTTASSRSSSAKKQDIPAPVRRELPEGGTHASLLEEVVSETNRYNHNGKNCSLEWFYILWEQSHDYPIDIRGYFATYHDEISAQCPVYAEKYHVAPTASGSTDDSSKLELVVAAANSHSWDGSSINDFLRRFNISHPDQANIDYFVGRHRDTIAAACPEFARRLKSWNESLQRVIPNTVVPVTGRKYGSKTAAERAQEAAERKAVTAAEVQQRKDERAAAKAVRDAEKAEKKAEKAEKRSQKRKSPGDGEGGSGSTSKRKRKEVEELPKVYFGGPVPSRQPRTDRPVVQPPIEPPTEALHHDMAMWRHKNPGQKLRSWMMPGASQP